MHGAIMVLKLGFLLYSCHNPGRLNYINWQLTYDKCIIGCICLLRIVIYYLFENIVELQ